MKDELIAKQKELIEKQDSIINFISLWGKFAELLQSQPESGRLIAYFLSKSRKLKSEISALEAAKEHQERMYPESFVLFMSGDKTSKGTRIEDWYKHWLKE